MENTYFVTRTNALSSEHFIKPDKQFPEHASQN